MMAIPTGGHSDWLFGLLSWIPRKLTAIEGPPPTDVTYSQNFDRVHNNPDVPNKGAWAVSESKYGISFAAVVEIWGSWWLIAIGSFRYDYADYYYEIPRFAIKKIR